MAETAGSADSWLKELESYSAAVENVRACKQGALDARAARQTFNELRAASLSISQAIGTMKNGVRQDAKTFHRPAIEAAYYLRAMLDVAMLDLREKAAAIGVVLPCLDRTEDE
jgi:hypothetical protein